MGIEGMGDFVVAELRSLALSSAYGSVYVLHPPNVEYKSYITLNPKP